MAISASFPTGIDQIKGPYRGAPANAPLHIVRRTILISGTYVTGGFQIDLTVPLASVGQTGVLYQGSRMGLSAISVISATAYGDYVDTSGATYTVNNASVAYASGGAATGMSAASTNNLVTLKVFASTNGVGGVELTNGFTLGGGAIGLLSLETWAQGLLGNV